MWNMIQVQWLEMAKQCLENIYYILKCAQKEYKHETL